jgi:prepilin-type N-terminal cleavage/methylation domain-containing protein
MGDLVSGDQGESMDRCERTGRAHEDGFTLVELVIVIVVLGILSGIVVFGVGRFRSDANAAACQADMTAVNAAADAYQAVTGNYPAAMSELTAGQYLRSAPASGSFAFDATARTVTRTPVCGGTVVVPSGTVAATSAGTTPLATTTAPAATSAGTTPLATTTAPAGTSAGTTPLATTTAPAGTSAGTTPPATTTAPAGACTSVVTIDNSWPQGYQGSVTVTNTGSTTYSPWTFTWTVRGGVTLNNGWNATFSQTGRVMTAQAPSWSLTLAPGASWAVGYIADGPSSQLPTAVTLNGIACN